MGCTASGVAAHQLWRGGHDLAQGGAHHLRHILAVVLAEDDVGNAPFADGAVLGGHVAQPRPEHAHGRLREYLRVQEYEGGQAL